jgi:hypothetical protein
VIVFPKFIQGSVALPEGATTGFGRLAGCRRVVVTSANRPRLLVNNR